MKTCVVRPLAVSALSGLLLLAGCSSSTPTPGPTTGGDSGAAAVDAGSGNDSGSSGTTVQGCGATDFEDHTAAGDTRTITPWNTSLGTKCYKIKVGQSVTWNGVPTSAHPLGATTDGTQPNPITDVATTAFPAAGTFGWHCTIHTGLMKGAIEVVP